MLKLDMCYVLVMPPTASKLKSGKISKSQILTPPHPQGYVMSVKCERPLDELGSLSFVSVLPPKLKILHFICKLDGITDGRTNRQTDGRTIRLLDAPGGPFMSGAYKFQVNVSNNTKLNKPSLDLEVKE